MNTKYCYAGNLATKTPDDFGWSDECITLNTPEGGGFPEFDKKFFFLKRVCSEYTKLYVNWVKMTVTQIHIKVSDPPAGLAGGDSQGMASCDPVSI